MLKKTTVIAEDFYKNPVEIDLDQLVWRPAAYGIVIKDNKLLLSKQINGYNLPGGGINIGEKFEDAVIREINEETGIIATKPRLVDAGTAFFKSWSKGEVFYQAVALYYECTYASGELSGVGLEAKEEDFTEGPTWLDIDELDNLKVGSYRDFKDVVRKVLKG